MRKPKKIGGARHGAGRPRKHPEALKTFAIRLSPSAVARLTGRTDQVRAALEQLAREDQP